MVSLRPGQVVLISFPLLILTVLYSLKVSFGTSMGATQDVLDSFNDGVNYLITDIPSWNSTSTIIKEWTGISTNATSGQKINSTPPTTSNQATTHPDELISAQTVTTDNTNDPNQTFSACLLVMDDNFRLREWLAYNYHVLPLRHLLVAVDKRSKLSPTPILDTFRQELGMNILEWKDEDYMTMADLPSNATAHATRERYLLRQRRFLENCMEHYYHAGHHWTACYDTDEAITISPETNGVSYQEVTGRSSFEKPGAVLDYVRKVQALDKNKTQLGEANCMIVPRTLFGSKETPHSVLNRAIPKGLNVDPFRLDTLRWRKHNKFDEKRNGLGKPLIDVSKMGPYLPAVVRNPHRVNDQLCGAPFHKQTKYSGLRINHYLGSWEQYSFRDDSRKGADRSREAWEFRSNLQATNDKLTHLWLKGFVADVGLDKANRLLNGTGIPKGYKKETDDASDWAVNTSAGAFVRKDDHHEKFLNFVKQRRNTTSVPTTS